MDFTCENSANKTAFSSLALSVRLRNHLNLHSFLFKFFRVQPQALSSSTTSDYRSHTNIQSFQRGGKCKHVHFENGSVIPAIEPMHVSSHFRLKWFQFTAGVMLSENRKAPASLFQPSSIILLKQNSSANPGNY